MANFCNLVPPCVAGPAADSEAEMIVLSEDNYKDLIGKQIKVIAVASSENELEIEKEKEVNVKIIAAADKTDEEQVAASAPPEKVDSNQQSTVGYFLSKNICLRKGEIEVLFTNLHKLDWIQ